MKNSVRWGLLSTARINRKLIPAIRAEERSELVAVASRNEERAAEYAQTWEIPQTFGSYDEMLTSDTIDAVYVPLPNHLHAEWSIRAMEAGKHVLCEKPFALTVDEVDRVAAVSQSTGMNVMEAFMYQCHPQTQKLQAWLNDGTLGDIRYMSSSFGFPLDDPNNVRLVPEWGGGALWDVGVYPVSLAQMVFGRPPTHVTAQKTVGETGVDVGFTGTLLYENGGVAQIECSFNQPFHQHAMIVGTERTVMIERPFTGVDVALNGMTLLSPFGEMERVVVSDEHLYRGEVRAMNDAILDGVPLPITLEQTRNHIETIVALYAASGA